MSRSVSARAAAAQAVAAVIFDGRSLVVALADAQRLAGAGDHALIQELSYGVLRWRWRLEALLTKLLDRPIKRKESLVQALLLIGLYQLDQLRVPPHAAVAETVECAKEIDKTWATGLINAVLRSFQRRQQQLIDSLVDDSARWSCPPWLLKAFQHDWPAEWVAILAASLERPPQTLRVSVKHVTRDAYFARLQEAGIPCFLHPIAPQGIVMAESRDVTGLPGYGEGHFSVQDAGAQLAAPLLQLRGAHRVLDACAAPGGKASHIWELMDENTSLTCLEIDPARTERIRENFRRQSIGADIVIGDAACPDGWWDKRSFDRILLDVPCTATGILRRHPDIKSLRQPADVAQLTDTQHNILASLWPLLSRGGILLYCTCSILRRENEMQIQEFLSQHSDAAISQFEAAWGHPCAVGRQVLPGESGMDGFYYVRLTKL